MFSLLFPKKKLIHTDLLKGTADVHSHLLPGVDDGVQSVEDMCAALKAMQSVGVKRVFMTPHVMSDMQQEASHIIGGFLENLLRKGLKPRQKNRPEGGARHG